MRHAVELGPVLAEVAGGVVGLGTDEFVVFDEVTVLDSDTLRG